MKKFSYAILAILCLLVINFNSHVVNAAVKNTSTTESYIVKPKLNNQLLVNLVFHLSQVDNNSQLNAFKFQYIAEKKAYIITDQSNYLIAKWDENNRPDAYNNLSFVGNTGKADNSELWNVVKTKTGGVIIQSKEDPSMVWNVYQNNVISGQPVNVSKKLVSPISNALDTQIFELAKVN